MTDWAADLPTPDWRSDDGSVVLYCADCLDVLPTVRDASLFIADPPYCGVLADEWDNQWANAESFLSWLGGVFDSMADAITDNGTAYVFASPRLSARVEVELSKRMRVIGNCVWCKGDARGGVAGSGIDATALRTFWPTSERCIVAEGDGGRYRAADDAARDACGYWDACRRAKSKVFGEYLRDEFRRAGVTQRQVSALFPSCTGGLTGCVSNWLLGHNCPTPEQYEAMRGLLNNGKPEYLRRDYEDMRRDYEDMRRPFNTTASCQWGDVWRWPIPRDRDHPAQKPIAMVRELIEISSRDGDTICDPFMGSGTTGVACVRLGRRFVGVEISREYFDIAVRRIQEAFADGGLFNGAISSSAQPQTEITWDKE